MSERVLFAHVELMEVPVTTGFPLTKVNVPDPFRGIVYAPEMKKAAQGGFGGDMEGWLLGLLLKPFILLVMFGGIVLPIRLAFQRFFPDGRVKRLLLRRIN
jgi:hypothetical protein